MRPLPPVLQAAGGSARAVFCARPEDDQIVLTTWGRSSGFCVDPIEKKPLNHFLPGTPSSPSVPPAATWPASSARTGTSASRARPTPSPTRPPRRPSRGRPPPRLQERGLHLQRPGHLPGVRHRRADACREPGINSVAVTAARSAPSRASSSTGSWMPPTSTSRVSPRASTARSAAAARSGARDARVYLNKRPTSGSRSRPC